MEIFVLAIVGIVGSAALFLWFGLCNPQKSNWGLVFIGLGVLVLACVCAGYFALAGGLGVAIAFLGAVIVAFPALISGLILAVKLQGRRKLFGALLGMGFPLALFLSIQLGDQNSPESAIQANARLVAQALDQYRADHGNYPMMLIELVPEYITDLRQPKTIWGWLYQANTTDFSLGFVYHVDRDGYSIYLYDVSTDEWDFEPPFSAVNPFILPPTPMP